MVREEMAEAAAAIRESRKRLMSAYNFILLGGRGESLGETISAAHNVGGDPALGKRVWAKVDEAESRALNALKAADHEFHVIAELHKAASAVMDEAYAKRRKRPAYDI